MFLRKSIIALTGLFLCIFLIVHLSANIILLLPQETARGLYNAYATTLRESFLIKIVAYVLYLSIILHVIYAIQITFKNRRAKPKKYLENKLRQNSSWASQNMGLLGVAILLFLVVHLANFWARIKLGLGEGVRLDDNGHVDVYEVTYSLFQNSYYVFFYTVLMVPLGLHLHHGFKSAFMTLGFYHKKGLNILAKISLAYAGMMSIGFGIIPLMVYLK
ncbi:Succinate dehydrogenase cytochrome b subunit [Croceitalea dokdonensis DOKDO 023]|uniref:Succinate dehydrogenase cytochrome b subunit n=1 Tax=Croceitalea dokdonensis DOKDO 023 TaxID=1300341 RepID=A0A0P7APR9_9FLAO|nr:succinate dehydrogenase cytochrome b subunit [Croceitalea dokdonensis]KPM30874.1 Succinate dehydrogenase cytochrome b subunit [Croceitalea dokdonensis DOKDO 023]